MARIRSVKPEFATDGSVRRLSDTTALFFILLWNHCDDHGFFVLDTWELAMKTARWRSQDIMRMLWALHGAGMVRLSTGHGVGMVVSWRHQRIDKPRPSKWQGVEIIWDEHSPFQERSKTVPRKDRRGEERRGEDTYVATQVRQTELPISENESLEPSQSAKKKRRIDPEETELFRKTWFSYSEAYARRHGTKPLRNGMINRQITGVIRRLGQEAPDVAEFFLTHNDSYYVRTMHPVGMLLKDAEKLRTEWITGRKMTGQTARAAEKESTMNDQLARISRGEL